MQSQLLSIPLPQASLVMAMVVMASCVPDKWKKDGPFPAPPGTPTASPVIVPEPTPTVPTFSITPEPLKIGKAFKITLCNVNYESNVIVKLDEKHVIGTMGQGFKGCMALFSEAGLNSAGQSRLLQIISPTKGLLYQTTIEVVP